MKKSRVLISSFAKVGTKTIEGSLRTKRGLVHVQSIKRMRDMMSKGNDIMFICGVRDFISRNMSYFFEQIDDPSYNDVQCSSNNYKGELFFLGNKKEILNMSVDELIDSFYSDLNHDTSLAWFRDFFKLIGFDINEAVFDKINGYEIYHLPNGNDLLLYRLDSLDDMIKEYNSLFYRLAYRNVGSNKWYADRYSEFKDKITFTEDYIEKQLDNEIMRFFYTNHQINKLKEKYK